MKVDDISESELIQAIEESLDSEQPDEGLEPGTITRPRVMEKYNISLDKATALITGLVNKGKLRRDWVTYHDGWGTKQTIKGYRWIVD